MKGYDILGLARQDIGLLKSLIPHNVFIGALEDTFGEVSSQLLSLIETGKVSGFRIHLRDGTCVRRKNCAPGTFPLNNLIYMGMLAKGYNDIAATTGKKCYLSPVLEYDEKSRSRILGWAHTLRHFAPLCHVIFTPGRGKVPRNYLVERHLKGNSYLVSSDGYLTIRESVNFLKSHRAKIKLLWWPQCNLLDRRGPIVAPIKRFNKITPRDMNVANRALRQVK